MFAGSVLVILVTVINVTRSEARIVRWKGKNDDQETIWILGGVDKDAGLFQKCLPVTKPGKGSCTLYKVRNIKNTKQTKVNLIHEQDLFYLLADSILS